MSYLKYIFWPSCPPPPPPIHPTCVQETRRKCVAVMKKYLPFTSWSPFWAFFGPHTTLQMGTETKKNSHKTENVPLCEASTYVSLVIALSLVVKILNNTTVALGYVSESPSGFSWDKLCQNGPKTSQIDQKLSTFLCIRPQVTTIWLIQISSMIPQLLLRVGNIVNLVSILVA